MKVKSKSKVLRRYIDYFLPREIMGPVVLVFSVENVIDILFSMYIPESSELSGWVVILIGSIIFVSWWGSVDEDMEELEEEMEEEGLIEKEE